MTRRLALLLLAVLAPAARAERPCARKAAARSVLVQKGDPDVRVCLDARGYGLGLSIKALQTGDAWVWLGAEEDGTLVGELAAEAREGRPDAQNRVQAAVEAWIRRRARDNAARVPALPEKPSCASEVAYDRWWMDAPKRAGLVVCVSRDGVAEGARYWSDKTDGWTWFGAKELLDRGWLLTEGGLVSLRGNWRLPGLDYFRPRQASRVLDDVARARAFERAQGRARAAAVSGAGAL